MPWPPGHACGAQASKEQAVTQMSQASKDAQMLRGGLYEMPMPAMQTYGSVCGAVDPTCTIVGIQ